MGKVSFHARYVIFIAIFSLAVNCSRHAPLYFFFLFVCCVTALQNGSKEVFRKFLRTDEMCEFNNSQHLLQIIF